MRPIYLCDLDVAARALLAAPKSDRIGLAQQIVDSADTADRYRKRFQKAHPTYGIGTMTSAADGLTRAKAPYCHQEYRDCLMLMLSVLPHQFA